MNVTVGEDCDERWNSISVLTVNGIYVRELEFYNTNGECPPDTTRRRPAAS